MKFNYDTDVQVEVNGLREVMFKTLSKDRNLKKETTTSKKGVS